jgi:2-(1,2-epoxy-1,2-dihydrophenyl)acetyl-CoA isomerase
MSYETIEFNIRDGIARLRLNRAERLNTFTAAMYDEIRAALRIVADSPEARVLVFSGTGRAFSAGQDLSDRAVVRLGENVDIGQSLERYNEPLITAIATLERPVICAVNGVAAGAGVSLALACDIVIAARSAKFIQSFVAVGIVPDSGGTWALPRLVGQARALGLSMTGEPLSAEDAQKQGLIWKCVDDEALQSEVDALARRFADGPTKGLAATKMLIRQSPQRSLSEALLAERGAMLQLGRTHDYQEGVAAFVEKRKPIFRGC